MSVETERVPSASDPNRSGRPVRRVLQTTASGGLRAPRWASFWWLAFLGLALAEVAALVVRVQRVPSEAQWLAAADLVRAELQSHDAITVAPAWADPLLRLYLGDRIPTKVEGRSELASFERLWVLAIRGARAPEAPERAPDFTRSFGRVTVERYDFAPTPVMLDLVDALPSASVEFVRGGIVTACPWRERVGGPARGGLGFGPVAPRQRFVCDETRPWLWVGATVLEDLSLAPRRCIWQHPEGKAPVSVTFHDVPLSSRIVLFGGLDYHNERDEKGAPVTMRVLASFPAADSATTPAGAPAPLRAQRELATLLHVDGEGMKRWEIEPKKVLGSAAPVRYDLRIEVTSENPHKRSFCWAGSIQDTRRREAP